MKKRLSNIKLAVIGLGYVGFPLAVEFSKKYPVIGFDLDKDRIKELDDGYDRTNEITKEEISDLSQLTLTDSLKQINDSNVYIITVPTPVDKNNKPDLNPIKSASKSIASVLSNNDVVIYESTVYPGCTEEVCVPILEKYSKLKYNKDFFCGYSPERINPGDKEHTLTKIKKITAGSDIETSLFIDSLYKSIISAGTCNVSSIAVAEAAKVIENTQRDVNIALINELAIIFNKLNIDTIEVLEAADTKWNFLPFRPGLVGGHCIGVDPYYLTYKAMEVGYHPDIILAGRKINDSIGDYIVQNTIEQIVKKGISTIGAKVTIMGLTFKENCPDLRNTKVTTIVNKLEEYQCDLSLCDEWVDSKDVKIFFDRPLKRLSEINEQDAIILAVSHDEYCHIIKSDWRKMLKPNGVLIDVKSIYNKNMFKNEKITHWRL